MTRITKTGVFLVDGVPVKQASLTPEQGRARTIAHRLLLAHHQGDAASKQLNIRFDALVSHDITYVGIIQTARASGLTRFPVPYALTNCHNSLCAVGGTINEDDHVFGLSAAKKYGGIYVPANQSVIHSFAREELAKCGAMILGSDSHTRYGALGTMGVGEGGPELVKQLLCNTYDIPRPEVVLIYLTGKPRRGVGPHDVALALIGATFASGMLKNKVLEFAGPGVAALSVDFRNGIDVMTTETTCLSSIWQTDAQVADYYAAHGRPQDYCELRPENGAYYDAMIEIDLDRVECMIALPFHPSRAFTIHEFNARAKELLAEVEQEAREKFGNCTLSLTAKVREDGRVQADQGVIAGCAGGLFENISEAAAILKGKDTGNGYFSLSVYPTSVPTSLALSRSGATDALLCAGAVIKPSFCGPCFGAGDVPANNGLSLRHTTRNFPNREGAKPGEGQLAGVALMDARSIAATAAAGGIITAATDIEYPLPTDTYSYDRTPYQNRVYNGFGNPHPETELILGPNITDWPKQYPPEENLLLELAAVIRDPVTTTDELIPSGETSSFRSNPQRLAQFTLSRRCPDYVGRAQTIAAAEAARRDGKTENSLCQTLATLGARPENTWLGSCVFANKPGDGSAREQAASCQRVLGGLGNICYTYATKRYRSNCINWGIFPFTLKADAAFPFAVGDRIFVPGLKSILRAGGDTFPATVLTARGDKTEITLYIKDLSDTEREILLLGGLMNYYAAHRA